MYNHPIQLSSTVVYGAREDAARSGKWPAPTAQQLFELGSRDDGLALRDIDRGSRCHQVAQNLFRGIDPRIVGSHWSSRTVAPFLRKGDARACVGTGRQGGSGDRERPLSWTAARHSHRGQRYLQHRRGGDGGRHGDPRRQCADFRRDRREASGRRRRGATGQAPAHRRCVRHPSSNGHAAPQSLECGLLCRRFVERFGRRDSGGALLWVARQRHRRFHPLSLFGQRHHRSEADMGTRQPPWRLCSRRQPRSYRSHDPVRRRCRGSAGCHCGP